MPGSQDQRGTTNLQGIKYAELMKYWCRCPGMNFNTKWSILSKYNCILMAWSKTAELQPCQIWWQVAITCWWLRARLLSPMLMHWIYQSWTKPLICSDEHGHHDYQSHNAAASMSLVVSHWYQGTDKRAISMNNISLAWPKCFLPARSASFALTSIYGSKNHRGSIHIMLSIFYF